MWLYACAIADDDLADFFDIPHLARGADQILLAAVLDVPCAHVRVVLAEGCHDILEGEPVPDELGGIRCYVELLDVATDRVDVGHARDVSQLRADDPILNGSKVGRRIGRAVRTHGTRFRFHRPEENLA